ncbi:hypothetical protein M0R45_005312 [Rubus argutus]|uniref:Uncharacterized protein n=1 Tax=Rubus argutus TaxID=59490 RepID=A0AAW1YM21_RUBAR
MADRRRKKRLVPTMPHPSSPSRACSNQTPPSSTPSSNSTTHSAPPPPLLLQNPNPSRPLHFLLPRSPGTLPPLRTDRDRSRNAQGSPIHP